jgi:hypothetical protein
VDGTGIGAGAGDVFDADGHGGYELKNFFAGKFFNKPLVGGLDGSSAAPPE